MATYHEGYREVPRGLQGSTTGVGMIVTVTLNPSIDRTIEINRLTHGAVNRASLIRIDAAGKGVNVSRALAAHGTDTHAILVGAELGGDWISQQLSAEHIDHTLLVAQGFTRSNVTLIEADSTVTKINEPGFAMTPEILAAVESGLDALSLAGSWVVFAGSLNPEADDDTYARLAMHARSRGALVALDASGPALAHAVNAGGLDLIKPNHHELSMLVDRQLQTISDVVDAAREIMASGVAAVLCSLGRDGALFVTPNEAVHAEAVHPVQGTPVGAGDILLAIFLAGGASVEALPTAIQWSAASVALPGTAMPNAALAETVKIVSHTELQLRRRLTDES